MSTAGVPRRAALPPAGRLDCPGPWLPRGLRALGAANERPRLVALLQRPEDVVAAGLRREQGLTVAAYGGGALPRSPREGCLALDLRGLGDVEVDRTAPRASRGGATAAAIRAGGPQHGLATTPWREGRALRRTCWPPARQHRGAIVRASADENL